MIPKTPQETTKNAHTTINDRLEAVNGFRKTLYIGLGVMALAIGAQKCTDAYQQRTLQEQVKTHQHHTTTYQARMDETLKQHSQELTNIRSNGFFIDTPCYDPDSTYRINVTPCSTKKTE